LSVRSSKNQGKEQPHEAEERRPQAPDARGGATRKLLRRPALLLGSASLVVRRTIAVARRRLTPSSPEIRVNALYWHLVDVVWIFLFPLLYLGGRS
jgi:hypothetical protein